VKAGQGAKIATNLSQQQPAPGAPDTSATTLRYSKGIYEQ